MVPIACRAMAYGDAKRKIFFYRILDQETQEPLDRKAICAAVSALQGEECYFDDGAMLTRAEVFDAKLPACLRFYKVRRDELPGKDDGQGSHDDLDLEDEEGLAEAIHLMMFPNGVVAAESFGHGPRATRFPLYLKGKLDMACTMATIVRHDVVEEALKFSDIRFLRVKLNPSETSYGAGAPPALHGLMGTAQDLHTGVYAELALRSDGGDQKFTKRVKKTISEIFGGNGDIDDFEKLEIEGKPDPDTRVTELDLLSERLYRQVEIPYRAQRTRELDADAAFAAIRDAYKRVKPHLDRDAEG
jgi:hypothetical protein